MTGLIRSSSSMPANLSLLVHGVAGRQIWLYESRPPAARYPDHEVDLMSIQASGGDHLVFSSMEGPW
jgi:hypothetical protein